MLFSFYPTDSTEVRDRVVAAARRSGPSPMLFTSLHIPESTDLLSFGEVLAHLARTEGFTFCADISPLTLERLGIDVAGLDLLITWGIRCVRIDFGFDIAQIRSIAAHGVQIALNASTVTASDLAALKGLDLLGWHNYYPRPETGLSGAFFDSQNRLCHDHGVDVVSFLPGELDFRAPLGLGLPTLEDQRHRNAWLNHLELSHRAPGTVQVCAEGTLLPEHQRWIEHHERTGVITIPVTSLDPSVAFLTEKDFRLRPEGTASSHRIEATRGLRTPERRINADLRRAGSLQADLASLGRYQGEVHLMRTDLPLTPHQTRVGDVAAPYLGIVDHLLPGDTVRFEAVG